MAAVAASGVNREARRRRIVERGADRLALIAGRIQSLPPDPDQSPSSAYPSGQFPADVAEHEYEALNSPSPDQKPDNEEPVRIHNLDKAKEPLLENSDNASLGVVQEEKSHISAKQSQKLTSSEQIPVNRIELSHRNSFTASRISSEITASENLRMYCSISAAILVILSSYIGFPTIRIKPLYLLLSTNISIVLARLIMGTRGSESRDGRTTNCVPKFSGDGLVDRLGKALESGLLMQKIFEAIFIDFGIYAVVLICSLSLVRMILG